MIVYFDTNVFDHLEQRNGVTTWDLFRIQRAIKHGWMRLVLSYLNIEETLFIISSQPKRVEARVKLILELADKYLFVLGQEMIMNNDIRAYAGATKARSPFMTMLPWMEIEIRNLVKSAGHYSQELENLIDETRQDKKVFQEFLIEGRAKLCPTIEVAWSATARIE